MLQFFYMNEIRILIKLVALAVTLYSIVRYYSTLHKSQAVSEERRRTLEPLRRISDAELKACRTVYGQGKKLVSGTPVYGISGYHRTEVIRIKNSSRVVHSIGDVTIEWTAALEPSLVGESRAEVAFTPGGTALVLSVPESFSVCEEAGLIQLLTGKASSSGQVKMGNAALEIRNREMSRAERAYRRVDLRIPESVLAGASLVIPFFFHGDLALVASGTVLFISLILLVSPRGLFGPRPKQLYALRGSVGKDYSPGGGTLSLGRFSLVIPPHWQSRISAGYQTTLTGYPRGRGFTEFVALSAGDSLSVDEDERKRRSFRYGRFAFAGALFFACLVFQSILVSPFRTVATTIDWLETRGQQAGFEGYDALTAEKPGTGREVFLTGLRVVPERLGVNEYDSNWMIVSPDALISPDFTRLRQRVTALADLQMTEEALAIRMLSADDTMQSDAIARNLVPSANGRRIGDYAETFADNPEFAPLVFRIDEYLAEAESSGTGEAEYFPMSDAFEYFIETEVARINESFGSTLEAAVEGVPRVSISNPLYEYAPYALTGGEDSVRFPWLSADDVTPYTLSTDYLLDGMDDAYVLKESLGADAIFASVASLYRRGADAAPLAGIVSEASWVGGYPSIRLEIGEGYADMNAAIRRLAVVLLTAALCLVCAGVAVAGILYTSRRTVFLSGTSSRR